MDRHRLTLPACALLLSVAGGCGSAPPPPEPEPPPAPSVDRTTPEFAVEQWLEYHGEDRHRAARQFVDPGALEHDLARPNSVIRALEEGGYSVHTVLGQQVWKQGDRARVVVRVMVADEIGRPEPWVLEFQLRRDQEGWRIIRLARAA